MSADDENALDWLLRMSDEQVAEIAMLDALYLLEDARTTAVDEIR